MTTQRGVSQLVIAIVISTLVLSALGGCGSSGEAQQAASASPRPMAPPRSASSLDFLDGLESKPVASADDVLRALAIAMNIEPPAEYPPLRQRAAGLGWIDADYPTSGTTIAPAAKAADAIARAGALQRPAGPGTALPAMASEGWISKAAAAKPTFSGADVLAAVSAAADYKAARTSGKAVSPKPLVMRPPAKFAPPVTRNSAPSATTDIAKSGAPDEWPPAIGPATKASTTTPVTPAPAAATTSSPPQTVAAAPEQPASTKRESFDDPPATTTSTPPNRVAKSSTKATPQHVVSAPKPKRPDTTELTASTKFPKPRPESLPKLPEPSHAGGGEQ